MKWWHIALIILLSLIAGCLTGVRYFCDVCDEATRTDTIYITKSGAFTVTNPVAVKTVKSGTTGKKVQAKKTTAENQGVSDTIVTYYDPFYLDSVPCDSFRTYVNIHSDSAIVIKSISQVQGVLLQEDISYSYTSPVSITSIIKKPVKRFYAIPQVGIEYNGTLTPIVGIGVIVKKMYFGYNYGMNQSQRAMIGWAF